MTANRVRSLLPVLAAAAALTGAAPLHADDCDCGAANPRTISVTGQAEVSTTADLAVVALAVETIHESAGTAVTENAERSAAVAAAVKQLLGKNDRSETTRYSLQPRYDHRQGEAEPRIVGYVASNEVRVELHDVDAVGKVIDAAIRAGANRVGSLSFTVENPQPQQNQALELAGKRARELAASIARATGVELGRVLSASSGYPQAPMPKRMEAYAAMARDSMAATPIEAGDVTVSAEVNVVYEIK
jgi:uncharacterized protein YggE